MIAYLKRLRDWATVGTLNVTSFSAPVWCNDNSSGSLVTPDGVGVEHIGCAVMTEDCRTAWIIKGVKPEDTKTTVTLADFLNAFDRTVKYTAPATGTSSQEYAAGLINSQFVGSGDEEYRVYVNVSYDDDSGDSFTPPATDDNGLFNVMEYFRLLRQEGVALTVSSYAPAPTIVVERMPASVSNVPFDDGHSQLVSADLDDAVTAKVTVVGESQSRDYYVDERGAISTQPPSPRVRGAWKTIAASDTPLSDVRKIFAANTRSHVFDFYSDRIFEWGEKIRCAYKGELYDAAISFVGISSDDPRYHYKAGDMAKTLTDKVRELKKRSSSAASPGGGGGGGGTDDHSQMINRDLDDQHPMSAITGLEAALAGKLPAAGNAKITGTSGDVPLLLQSAERDAYLQFLDFNGVGIGYYGVNDDKEPVFADSSGQNHVLAYKSEVTPVDVIEEGNMHPVTSNAVHACVGNIEVLLEAL